MGYIIDTQNIIFEIKLTSLLYYEVSTVKIYVH
jgi:hypothetical protein